MSASENTYPTHNYVIHRSLTSSHYSLYHFDPESEGLFTEIETTGEPNFDNQWRLAQVGQYLLQWGPVCQRKNQSKNSMEDGYQFKVINFDPSSTDPLNGKPLQSGFWPKNKFWDYRKYYSTNPNEDKCVDLISTGSFVLNTIFTEGRGTFRLFNFDAFPDKPGSHDPLTSYFGLGQGSFPLIKKGHTLIPIGNYVIDRMPDGRGFKLWSFDPQLQVPLSLPAIREGNWHDIDSEHQLLAIGDLVLDWIPSSGHYRLWEFNPESDSMLVGPLKEGILPKQFNEQALLTPFQSKIAVQSEYANTPGTMDFMRSKIKHVVYYMVESRSFDNVLGWLYENGDQDCHFIGSDQAFDGASKEDFNRFEGQDVHVSKFKDGQLSEQWDLMALTQDPFHNTIDNLQQMFSNIEGYWQQEQPDMGGFVLNNANPQVMETFTPTQLPVLNGLAKEFAVSDQWFCSIPGGTDVNRGFSVTGSAYDKLGTWEGGDAYKYFPDSPHRQSIWKVLWNYGIDDWKIYYSMEWKGEVFTNQLYLKGQIPSVDANPDQYIVDYFKQFESDVKNSQLPAFSYIEPLWYKPKGTTSYHPGCDLVPAEQALNTLYNIIKQGPDWESTLLVVTFDKNNGTYDHVKPPYARKPWPNDMNNGFAYDLMGPRVPAVMISPWIKQHTVFRSVEETPYDSTSFAATLLHWFGIPKAQWGLGDRMEVAPTFESVFQQSEARVDLPEFKPPYDKMYPKN
jgi:phospholipase C